ncbi:gamma-glutamyltranspeptidase [Arthroderma uncinatum]|uniref:gamma-glutamyltranspeptidase n=1 Tax=Arthroderma uncinatum TaxID=74035 RepID=UPI00144A8615|nr:gamma-glutamyltranspeptidase [Arthroderma uncinatum]KAF3482584.1 gamma-glutamyltranspeptidase [Arthroderma uncinatum]
MLFPALVSALLHSTALVTASAIPPVPGGGSDDGRSTGYAARGISIASESQYCNQKGVDFFKQNKNATAADAIIATVLCIGTVAMYHSGIGGGGFALVKKENKFEAIDFRPVAPNSANDSYYDKHDVHRGGAASGVPGELKGLWELHRYGGVPWNDLFTPAMKAAKGDFHATDDMMYFIQQVIADPPIDPLPIVFPECGWLGQYPWNETFCRGGKLLKKGDPVIRETYVKTLENIASKGEKSFYEGDIADSTYRTLSHATSPSLMTKEDLKNYKVEIRAPVNIDYHGYTVTSTPIPASGTVVLSILKVLEKFMGNFNPGADEISTHWLIEALRFGYAQRSRLGDPDMKFKPDIDMDAYQKWLIDGKNGFASKVNITDKALRDPLKYILPYPSTAEASLAPPSGKAVIKEGGTSHVVALDSSGLAISLTTSVGEYFGSRVMDPQTGIIFDDVMADFQRKTHDDPLEFANNHIENGGKRPLSGMSPTIITDNKGHVRFVTGSAGGMRIPSATLQIIINVIDRKMSAKGALSAPRLHDQLSPNITEFDLSLTNDTRMYNKPIVKEMRDRNHRFTWVETGGSSAQAIKWDQGQAPDASGEEWQSDSGGCVWWDGKDDCPFKNPRPDANP